MKAIILAGGKGERLKDISHGTPKCLMPINGKPLLQYWLDMFEDRYVKREEEDDLVIDDILINLTDYNKQVIDYIQDVKPRIRVSFIIERDEQMGTARTLWRNKKFIRCSRFCRGEMSFLIIYADNYTNMNLTRLVNFHKKRMPIATIGLFKAPNPKECGIVEVDSNHIITSIVEKPENPTSNLAFAGVMVGTPLIFTYLQKNMQDIAKDLLPRLVTSGRLYGFEIQEKVIDIGTPEGYQRANEQASIADSPVHEG